MSKFLLTLALALAVMASPALAAPMPMPDEPVAFASSLDEATYATSAGSYAVAASQPAEALACTGSGLSADVSPSHLSLPLYASIREVPADGDPGWRL